MKSSYNFPSDKSNNYHSSNTTRRNEYRKSNLPYSFAYKIKNAFVNKKCPICGCFMNYENNLTRPTIQHNIPISKGGKHELCNISVICFHCNSSVKNIETGELNNEDVIKIWDEICCDKN